MEKISLYLTEKLSDGSEFSEYEKIKLQLGIEIILHNILMIGSLLFLANLAGTFQETVIFFCVFGSIRIFAGGFHFNSGGACLAGTGIMVFMAGWISENCTMGETQKGIAVLVSLLLLITIAPQGTKQNPIVNGSFKYLAMLLVVFWYIMERTALSCYGNMIIVAILFQTTSLLVQKIKNQAAVRKGI